MKTKTLLYRTIVLLGILVTASYSFVEAKKKATASDWLKKGLNSVPAGAAEVKNYKMTSEYINYDLNGNFLNKLRSSGIYSTGFGEGKVTWSNCTLAFSNQANGDFSNETKMDYMEGFTYTPGTNMVASDAFPNFPPDAIFAKNLVWDMMGFDAFGTAFLDSLTLNKPFKTSDVESAIPLAGEGTFVNKNTAARWNGISEMNGKLCAVIEFRQINGQVEVNNTGLQMKGRSHYWGNIWVSLENRSIEFADLYESVTFKMKFAGQEKEQWYDTYRILKLEKLTQFL